MNLLKSLFKFLFIFLFLIFIFPMSCTNLQVGQTSFRFYENMRGNLRSFNNFTPTVATQFSFSAMGDVHIGSPGGDLFVRALNHSKAAGDEFTISLGDNSNTGTESELLTFTYQYAGAAMTVYPVIGNHDIFFGGWNNYKTILGRSIYSFDAGNTHFTVLDSANGTIGEEQLNWLENDLRATTKTNKIVALHFPIYIGEFSSIYKISSDEEIAILKNMFNRYRVNLVLSGHYHGYSDKTINGTRYVVSGACNHILDPGNRSGYLKISINGSQVNVTQQNLD